MIDKRKEARIGRPRIFDPSERCDLHVYLHPHQLQFILKTAHKNRQSPSKIIRDFIDEMQERSGHEEIDKRTV